MTECFNMTEVRAKIDELDRQIVALIAQRTGYVGQAARLKKQKAQIVDLERIEDIIRKVRLLAGEALISPDLIEKIYRQMIESFINYEEQEWEKLNGL